MPRLKKPDARRQRSLRACVHCRKRKEKCNGEQPCASCSKRGLDCQFSAVTAQESTKSTSRSPQTRVDIEKSLSGEDSDRRGDTLPEDIVDNQTGRGQRQRRNRSKVTNDSEAPVPRSARLLSDGHGKIIYIGDSASVSFVQNVRRIVSLKLGECDFTNDIFRHSFLEQSSISNLNELDHFSPASQQSSVNPSLEEAQTLLNRFFSATSCILDIFDKAELTQTFQLWISDPSYTQPLTAGILHLILAIGSQAVNEPGFDVQADQYLASARHAVSSTNIEEPCMQTVQYYMLLAMYHLGACRRNASYMNFGIAVRAAYALGLHRGDLYPLFSESERRSRERIWQSLRIIDVFLSASLGRPPSTSDFEGHQSTQEATNQAESDFTESAMSAALSRLCPIFEKILYTVYKKQGVSTRVVDEISQSYRAWATELPQLPVDSESTPLQMCQILGSVHVLGAYHWSIILLTRPFLMFQISSNSRTVDADQISNKPNTEIPSASTFAESCVDSAIKALDIAGDLPHYPELPRRLPFVLNFVFISALAIGAAFFGDYDRRLPLEKAMDKAEMFLDYMQEHDPQAERYAQIISHLRKAATMYIGRRDQLSMQRHRKLKISLFGDVGANKLQHALEKNVEQATHGSHSAEPYRDITSQSPSRSSAFSQPQQGKTSSVGFQPCTRDAFSNTLQSTRHGERESVLAQNTEAPLRTISTADEFAPDFSTYNFTIPTLGVIDGLELDFGEETDFRNFLMPIFP